MNVGVDGEGFIVTFTVSKHCPLLPFTISMYVEGAILVFRVGVRVVPPELIPPEGEEVQTILGKPVSIAVNVAG